MRRSDPILKKLLLLIPIVSTLLAACAPSAGNKSNSSGAELPGYLITTLEIIRRGKSYSVPLGYDLGQAFWHTTPSPNTSVLDHSGLPEIDQAQLEWYGDIDGDGEYEYIVRLSIHCAVGCVEVAVVDYDPQQDSFRIFDSVNFRASAFQSISDLNQDGSPEIIGRDEDFTLAMGYPGAATGISPIKIYRYNGQKIANVTRQYPEAIEQDANTWLDSVKTGTGGRDQIALAIPAYLADMYLLGRREEGIQMFIQLCTRDLYSGHGIAEAEKECNDFLNRVQNALSETGYN